MKTVMIVEDELEISKFLRTIIEKNFTDEFNQIIVCNNGKDAIDQARNVRVDLLITDLSLPGVEGIDVHKTLKLQNTDICTVILTAHQDFHYIHEAMEVGIRKYLLKPIRPNDLVEQLKILIEKFTDKVIKTEWVNNNNSEIINEAISYLHQNYQDKITLESVAEYIHLNPQYFSRLFKKETHTSFVDYLNELRVKHACQLLSNSDFPAYRIALEAGFSDSSYFTRVFAKHMEVTPSEYRKKEKINTFTS